MRADYDCDIRMRILAIERMLSKERRLTTKQIIRRLETHYGITADRKTIYADIAAIDRFIPLDISTGYFGGYKIAEELR